MERCVLLPVAVGYTHHMECNVCHRELREQAVFCPACGEKRPGAREFTGYQYAAFISYRHVEHDAKAAREIQQFIETYRLPEGVAERAGVVSASDRRLGRVFRDEDELAASASLPDRIADALAASRALIVMCSRASAASVWVDREVQAYAELHGRDRIFTVLLDGDSHEVLPQTLRTKAVASADGSVAEVPSEPLSVDMRGSGKDERRAAMLRVVAGLAGCGYDDLVQRDKQRMRKRKMTAAVAAVVALAIVAGLGAFGFQKHRESQVNESMQLAVQAQQQFAEGDRYGAIESALKALPSPADGGNRPYVPEAQAALEEALGMHRVAGTRWNPAYTIDMDGTIGMPYGCLSLKDDKLTGSGVVAAHISSYFFAVSDDQGKVATYDNATGRQLATCEMPYSDKLANEKGAYVRQLTLRGRYLIVAHLTGMIETACFDGTTGALLWCFPADLRGWGTVDENGDCPFVMIGASGLNICATMNMQTGKYDEKSVCVPCKTSHMTMEVCSVRGSSDRYNYVTIGDDLISYDRKKHVCKSVNLAFPMSTSVACADGVIVAASTEYDLDTTDKDEREYAIEAFDKNLNKLWEMKGTSSLAEIESDSYRTYVRSLPLVDGSVLKARCFVLGVEHSALVISAKTGEVQTEKTFNDVVIDAQLMSDDAGNPSTLCVVLGDGSYQAIDVSGRQRKGDWGYTDFKFPDQVRWADSCVGIDKRVYMIALSADAPNHFIVYYGDKSRTNGADREYTLEELAEQGHAVLEAAGRR